MRRLWGFQSNGRTVSTSWGSTGMPDTQLQEALKQIRGLGPPDAAMQAAIDRMRGVGDACYAAVGGDEGSRPPPRSVARLTQ